MFKGKLDIVCYMLSKYTQHLWVTRIEA